MFFEMKKKEALLVIRVFFFFLSIFISSYTKCSYVMGNNVNKLTVEY
jgi:hypothetical protein